MSAERKCGRLLSGWRAAAMSDAEYIAELTRLGKELDATDSKAREDEIKKLMGELPERKRLDGRLATIGGKQYRIWHAYYAAFYAFGNARWHYKWRGNKHAFKVWEIELTEEPELDLDRMADIDGEVHDLQSQIDTLQHERNVLRKGCIHVIDPDSFEETDERDTSAYNMDGSPVMKEDAHCLICGARVTT